ncbi:MAG: ribosome silencing factor [Bacteriovorax sp.]|nr:ribosome silencing factor [Bacteriovorax sp.]
MSREYVIKEVQAIYNDKSFEAPLNIAMASAWIMGNFKGINLKVLDLRNKSSIADFFVIGSAGNPTQAAAMAEEISFQMRNLGIEALSREGLKHSTDWILLDYGDVIIHVFHEPSRNVYDLDMLYKNALSIEIPESYYFSTPESERKGSGNDDGRNYF